jgi:hypothetical protein
VFCYTYKNFNFVGCKWYTIPGNISGTGNADFSKFLGLLADTVSAPSFTWSGDLTTGISSNN